MHTRALGTIIRNLAADNKEKDGDGVDGNHGRGFIRVMCTIV